jgi:hypothetical protein
VAFYGEVAVGTADAVVLPAAAGVTGLLLSNPGPVDVFVAFGQAAIVGRSILLPTGGAPLALSNRDWPGLITLDLHAVAAGAGGRLAGFVES